MHRALGGVVSREAGTRTQARGRADIDDHAAAILAHHRHHGLREQKQPLHVDREDAIEFRLADVEHRLVDMADAGIVDQDVERAEGLERRRDRGIDIGAFCHVAAHEDRILADRRRRPRGRLSPPHRAPRPSRLRARRSPRSRPHARSRAGDDGNLVRKTHVSLPTFYLAATPAARSQPRPSSVFPRGKYSAATQPL